MQVYQLHEKGTRLDRTKVMRRIASLGDLIIRERPDMPGRGLLIAQLLNPDLNYVIPLLDQATVTRITPRGILIEGTELIPPRGAKGFYTRYQQAWWCEPVTEVPRQTAPKQAPEEPAWRRRQIHAAMPPNDPAAAE